jgi:hypothetical protein
MTSPRGHRRVPLFHPMTNAVGKPEMPFRLAVRRVAQASVALTVACIVCTSFSSPARSATATPTTTLSYYEASADSAALMNQGESAGEAGAQGLVILDFGRPAVDKSIFGILDFDGTFVSLSSAVAATMSHIQGYLATAPPNLQLHVAIGTNNSCGAGQPCGTIVCGCTFEPPS